MWQYFLIAIAVFVFWGNIRRSENPILDMSVNALMMACGFSPLLLIDPSCMRVVQYYSVYLMFLLPELRYVFRKNSRMLFLRILAVIMIALLMKQMPSYRFFFM